MENPPGAEIYLQLAQLHTIAYNCIQLHEPLQLIYIENDPE